ncbi:MAG: ABC transporter permease [Desulfobacteraceae bacterium 4572_35.2]|nr:MAG: ABC transporter permease [Desulfobacteraceae bacterium 4572_35.2]
MLIRLAWRNVWRNRLRSAIMITATLFGLLGVLLMIGFINAMTENMIDNAIRLQTSHLQIHRQQYLINSALGEQLADADQLSQQLHALPHVAAITLRQRVDGVVASAITTRGVQINGVDMAQESAVVDIAEKLVAGTVLPEQGRNPILLSGRLAAKLNVRLGSKVVLTFSDITGEVTGASFRVCGLFDTASTAFDEGQLFVRRGDLAHYSGIAGVHEIAVRLKSRTTIDEDRQTIAAQLPAGAVVRDWRQIQPILASMMASMDLSNAIVAGVFILALGFGMVNIMLMAVFERTREFAVLIATGMSRLKVLGLILLEACFLGAAGALVGLLASWLLIQLLGNTGLPLGAMAQGLGAYGVDAVLYPTVALRYYVAIFIMVVLVSVIAALYPARQILIKPLHSALAEKH